MKVTYELNLVTFEAWSGGEKTLDRILEEGKEDEFIALLEDLYPEGIDETALNDLLRFDADWICESLGMKTDEEQEEEEAAREKAKAAIRDVEDVHDLCERYDLCGECPLYLLSDDCYSAFDDLKDL